MAEKGVGCLGGAIQVLPYHCMLTRHLRTPQGEVQAKMLRKGDGLEVGLSQLNAVIRF